MNLPMSCSRPAVCTSSCSSLREPGRDRDLTRIAGDGRAVARGHPVPEVERVHDRAQDADLEARKLLGARAQLLALRLQFLGALLGEQELAEQVLEREEHEAEERDRRDADLDVEVGDADRQQRGRELGGQNGDHELAHLVHQRAAVEVAAVQRDDQEVHRERDHEGDEHEQVEDPVLVAEAGASCATSNAMPPISGNQA